MRIKKIISQNRRDFKATYECEHCGKEENGEGYDDAHFHQNVIPSMICRGCKLTASDDYRPLTTKYEQHETV